MNLMLSRSGASPAFAWLRRGKTARQQPRRGGIMANFFEFDILDLKPIISPSVHRNAQRRSRCPGFPSRKPLAGRGERLRVPDVGHRGAPPSRVALFFFTIHHSKFSIHFPLPGASPMKAAEGC